MSDETPDYVHSLDAQSLTVSQCLIHYLKIEEVCTLFGIPGGASMYVLNDLRKNEKNIRYVISRHETGASYMADGYSRVTGKLGVVLVTSGPGATNALTGAVNAQSSNSSVLVVSGEVPESAFGKGYLQEGTDSGLSVDGVYRSATQYSTAIVSSADNFSTLFGQALRSSLSRPRRTSHISLPMDVSNQSPQPGKIHLPKSPENYRATPRCTSPQESEATFRRLFEAAYPLIFLGGGCREALEEPGRLNRFLSLVDRFALPVMTTPGAKALFPESHPLSLRTYGLAGCLWPDFYLNPKTIDSSRPPSFDVLVVLASTLGQLGTDKWDERLTPSKTMVQVDLDQRVIGRGYPVELGVVAEVGVFLDDLMKYADTFTPDHDKVEARRSFIAQIKAKHSPYIDPASRDSDASPVLPQALMKALNELLPSGSHLFIDAGNCVGWSLHYLEVDPPTQVHSALGMGPMGFAVAAVIGAKIGAPDEDCVALVGDGAFLMHGNEVSTAAQHNIGAIWVVLYDNDLNMVSQGMANFFPDQSDPGAGRAITTSVSPTLSDSRSHSELMRALSIR